MGDFRLGKTAVLGKAPVSTGFKLGMGKVPQCVFGVHINDPTGNVMVLHDAYRGKEFQPNDAGLEGYPYRAEVAYNPSVGGSEGYQFLVKTYYAEDAEHGGDAENVNGTEVLDGEPTPIPKIYLNRLCRWDFGDVRFQLKGVVGASAYTYRLIEKVDGVWALFMFKMNENPDTARTVCCYWGKQTAVDESSDDAAEAIIPDAVLAMPLDVADKEEELLSNVYAYDISIETDNNGNYTAKDADGTVIDTSTDATSIFTNMSYAASLIESGGTIYVKAGTYTGLSSVQLHSDVTWVGDGDSTVLKLMDNAPTGIYTLANIKSSVFLGLEVENVIIKNIKFDGNKAENTISFQDHDHETLLLCDSENILITNVTAVNSAKTGIHIRNCVNVQVENCLIDGSATFGFAASSWYDGLCTNVNIRHSTVKNSGWNHISFQRIHTTTGDIYGCGAYNNYMEGDCGDIALDTWGNNENYLVHNIYFVNNTVNGMSGIGSSGIEAHFGLRLEKAEQCYAIGNTLLNVNRGIMDDPWGNGNHIIVCNTVKLKDTATIIPMGIELYGNNNYIDNNDVTSAPTGYSIGIIFGGGSNVVSCNVFHELDKELWAFVGVQTEYGTGNNIIELNDFSDTNSIEIFLESDIVRNNVDYSSSDDGQSNLPRRLFIASDGDSGVEGISSTVVETKEGDSEQFIFSVKEGYELLHVYVDGVDVIDTFPSKYTFSNLNQHHVIIGESVLSAGGLPENIVFDYSGNGNHGAATGTTITDGPHAGKKCRYFSGSDVITVLHHASLLCEKELTVLIRIKPSINAARSIMAKNGWSGQFYLRQNLTYGLYAISSYTGGGVDTLEQSNVNWYGLAAFALVGYTIDLNNNVQKLWVNGVEKYSEATASDKTLVQDTGNITIGAGPEADFNGYACDVAIIKGVVDGSKQLAYYNNYPDPRLEQGKIYVRKWASTTLPTVASVSSMQTRRSYGKQELYPAIDNLNFALDQANKKASVEFYLENTQRESASAVVVNDGTIGSWSELNYNAGSYDAVMTQEDGRIKVTVGAGTHAICGIKLDFAQSQNWSTNDFYVVELEGTNSGKQLRVNVYDNAYAATNYNITDNFIGRKVFPIPMVTYAARNTNVRRVSIESTPDANFVYYLRRIVVDNGVWAKVEIGVPDQLVQFPHTINPDTRQHSWDKVVFWTWNGASFVATTHLQTGIEGSVTSSIFLRSDKLYFLNSSTIGSIYGHSEYWNIWKCACVTIKGKNGETKGREVGTSNELEAPQTMTYSKAKTKYRIGLIVKMPPADLNASATSGGGQCRLKLEVYYI